MKRKLMVLLFVAIVIMCSGCKKETHCEICGTYTKCKYLDDGYYCEGHYEDLKEIKEMEEEYNRLYN